ncbi:hypothetical protein ACP275_05G099400 [Erythranthe tilingii]
MILEPMFLIWIPFMNPPLVIAPFEEFWNFFKLVFEIFRDGLGFWVFNFEFFSGISLASLAAMILCFEWKADGVCTRRVDMEEGIGITLPMANPLICSHMIRLNSIPSGIYFWFNCSKKNKKKKKKKKSRGRWVIFLCAGMVGDGRQLLFFFFSFFFFFCFSLFFFLIFICS